MNKKYIVRLTRKERKQLERMISVGKAAAYKIKHANILLMTDANGPEWTDEQIAEAFACHPNTVRGVRQRLVEQGLEAALERRKQASPPRGPVLDGRGEARLIALSRSAPPEGRERWTLRLLAAKLVELEVADSISHETVRQRLKKTN